MTQDAIHRLIGSQPDRSGFSSEARESLERSIRHFVRRVLRRRRPSSPFERHVLIMAERTAKDNKLSSESRLEQDQAVETVCRKIRDLLISWIKSVASFDGQFGKADLANGLNPETLGAVPSTRT